MNKIHYKHYFCLLILFFYFPFVHGAICTSEEADAADLMVDTLNNWASVNETFQKFKQCDDGSIAEGNSEAIARLLVDHWNTLPELSKLIQKNPELEDFVLSHIDTTLDTSDLEKIEFFSKSKCPTRELDLCLTLNKAAEEAINSI